MDLSEIQKLLSEALINRSGPHGHCRAPSVFYVDLLNAANLRVEFYENEVGVGELALGISNLLQLSKSLEKEVNTQIFQSYLSGIQKLGYTTPHEAIQSQELEDHVPPKTAGDVSTLVDYFSITGNTRKLDGATIISVRGNTAWDCEHGIALFFENGQRLIKVGGLNDSVT